MQGGPIACEGFVIPCWLDCVPPLADNLWLAVLHPAVISAKLKSCLLHYFSYLKGRLDIKAIDFGLCSVWHMSFLMQLVGSLLCLGCPLGKNGC